MLLTPARFFELCAAPAHAADLVVGRALEERCALHLKGERAALQSFLTSRKPSLLASPEAFTTLLEVMSPASATLLEGPVGLLNKPFTATGGTAYYEFTDPALSDDFQAFLADATRAGLPTPELLASIWKEQSLVGFQGVFLLDLREPQPLALPGIDGIPAGLPEPFFRYVPSGNVHDIECTGSRLEYLILNGGVEETSGAQLYYCWDDAACYVVAVAAGLYTLRDTRPHGLPTVPACFVTTQGYDATRPVIRTCPLVKVLPRLDDYLADYNWVRLGNAYHANPQKWSKAVTCEFTPPAPTQAEYHCGTYLTACSAGYVTRYDNFVGTQQPCPRCKGKGAYIPTGPDKVYLVQQAQSKDDPEVLPVAGYIVPDLTSLQYLVTSCKDNEEAIEKALLGKSGLLAMQTKAESGFKALTDLSPLTDRCNARGNDSIYVEKFLTDGYARLRYGPPSFRGSQLSRGRRYHFYDEATLLDAFATAKKGGNDAGVLYALLEDALYAKFADDPMELQRALLKLELTPAPHLTAQEALELDYVGVDDLLLKTFINDFIARFERENGSILDFGSLISHAKKIAAIQAKFDEYTAEKRGKALPGIVPGRYTTDPGGQDPGPLHPNGSGAGAAPGVGRTAATPPAASSGAAAERQPAG